MRIRVPRLVAKPSARAAGIPWPRVTYGGNLAHERVEVPPGDVTVDIVGARWDHVDLSGQRFANFGSTGSVFVSCNFRRCTFEDGILGSIPLVIYRGCDFELADLRNCSPLYARFERCRFTDARLEDWRAVNAEFVDCVFAGRLLRVMFSGTPSGFEGERIRRLRRNNEFRGNDFRDAQLFDCSFEGGIDLDANLMPDTPEYAIIRGAHERIEEARARIFEQPESVRQRVQARLDVYSMGGYKAQRDIFVRREELGPAAALLLDP